PDAVAAPDGAVGGLGGQPRLGLVERDVRVERVALLDAHEQRVHHVHGRQRARLERARELGDAGPDRIDGAHRSSWGAPGWPPTPPPPRGGPPPPPAPPRPRPGAPPRRRGARPARPPPPPPA